MAAPDIPIPIPSSKPKRRDQPRMAPIVIVVTGVIAIKNSDSILTRLSTDWSSGRTIYLPQVSPTSGYDRMFPLVSQREAFAAEVSGDGPAAAG